MKLHEFQMLLLKEADQLDSKEAKCLRDCVNYSGNLTYELNSKGEFSAEKVVKRTMGYQLSRFNVSDRVKEFCSSILRTVCKLRKNPKEGWISYLLKH